MSNKKRVAACAKGAHPANRTIGTDRYTRVSNIKGVKGKGSTAEHNTGKLEIFPCVT